MLLRIILLLPLSAVLLAQDAPAERPSAPARVSARPAMDPISALVIKGLNARNQVIMREAQLLMGVPPKPIPASHLVLKDPPAPTPGEVRDTTAPQTLRR